MAKNLSTLYSDGLFEICKPLFQLFDLSYFSYVRIYHENRAQLILGSNPLWIETYIEQQLFDSKLAKNLEKFPDGHYLWSHYTNPDHDNTMVIATRRSFNIDNGIISIKRHPHYTEFTNFASSVANKAINNFYFNNVDILNKFTTYFKDKAHPLIDQAEKQSLIVPPTDNKTIINSSAFYDDKKRNEFLKQINYPEISVTARELDCIKYLLKGMTAKESAQLLQISHRTVEEYLNNARKKLNSKNNAELIYKLYQQNLLSEV